MEELQRWRDAFAEFDSPEDAARAFREVVQLSDDQAARCTEIISENESLRDVLSFYAVEENYKWSPWPDMKRGVIQAEDRGAKARAVLEPTPTRSTGSTPSPSSSES